MSEKRIWGKLKDTMSCKFMHVDGKLTCEIKAMEELSTCMEKWRKKYKVWNAGNATTCQQQLLFNWRQLKFNNWKVKQFQVSKNDEEVKEWTLQLFHDGMNTLTRSFLIVNFCKRKKNYIARKTWIFNFENLIIYSERTGRRSTVAQFYVKRSDRRVNASSLQFNYKTLIRF